MASESAEGASVSVELPDELAEWLHAKAEDLEVTPETLLQQLLSSYRTTATLSADVDGAAVEIDLGEPEAAEDLVEPIVAAAVGGSNGSQPLEGTDLERIEEAAAAAAREAVAEEAAVSADRIATLESRLEALEDDVADKIEDVRGRVIEVKRETDGKAPTNHDHEAIDAMNRRLSSVEDEIDALRDSVSALDAGGAPDRLETLESDLDDVEDRLTTVAWIVRDLREARETDSGEAALSQLKREAAAADVSRAKCENCGEGVDISLLTEPSCPHCEATVSTVDPASGFFSKPTLRVASQLTAGETP